MTHNPFEKKETVEAKLGFLDWKKAPESHIKLRKTDGDAPCAEECKDKPCVTICPAKVYEWEPDQKKVMLARK